MSRATGAGVLLRQQMGEELRQIRHQKGLKLACVAHRANVSTGHLSEIERGKNEASSEVLAAICDALEVALTVSLEARG